MHRHFAMFAAESHGLRRNMQKLTGNTKNGQILNIVIKYSLSGFGSWRGNYLKSKKTSITGDIF